MTEDLSVYLDSRRTLVEQALMNAIPADWNVNARLRESAMYSLAAGGKRLRPIFVLTAAEAVRGEEEDARSAMPFAVAVEMVHTYSLIHDDLPAMDDDDYRRGIPTNHKVYGEATAILAGDGLLTHAFYVASQAPSLGVSAERTLAVVGDLARLAGLPGMVGGQADDMEGEQGITSIGQLEHIHLHKTSDLIAFSLRAGGHAGGASDRQLDALGRYGTNVGLAFQIQDDILDITGDQDILGKPVGSDERQGKVTYPYLIGLEASRRRVADLTEEAIGAIRSADLADCSRLEQIARYLTSRDK
ncbi:polyprenyl synthetase family protein [Cohnella rhizoplanae]|uniref:polyprenyl synthetase family protein n=1 Tax=Cohnella rhizoplanae TaxID=2974897 RepID=UPI003D7C2E6F